MLDFVLRCIEAGHDVRWFKYADKGKVTRDGEGFKGLKIVDEWRASMPWAKDGLIITSGNFKFMHDLDRYRDLGYKIFAPSVKSAQLEINRKAGMDLMKSVGIETPPYFMFGSLEEAQAFARKSSDAYAFKTLGDETDKSLSYVSSDPADMVGWIGNKIARGMVLKGPCMLQEKIDMLCDFGAAGWMGPEGFLPGKFEISFEHKKRSNDEKGMNTGEQGTLIQIVETDKLVEECLKPLEPVLQALGHCGDFAIGVGVDTKGRAWPFEFTARCGWPDFHIRMATTKGDPAQWMRDWLDGKDTLKVDRRPAIGVVMSHGMYPHGKSPPETVEGIPIYGLDEVWDDVHPVAVMIGKGPMMKGGKVVDGPVFQTTGEYVLVATGIGSTIAKAKDDVYSTISKIKFSDADYRTDISDKVVKVLPDLHRHGYSLGLT
jgi:phosphoribosylamine--glycine ligase